MDDHPLLMICVLRRLIVSALANCTDADLLDLIFKLLTAL